MQSRARLLAKLAYDLSPEQRRKSGPNLAARSTQYSARRFVTIFTLFDHGEPRCRRIAADCTRINSHGPHKADST